MKLKDIDFNIENSPILDEKYQGEIMRKGTHIVALSIPLGFLLIPRDVALCIIVCVALGSALHDFLRVHHKPFRKFIYRLWGKMYRRWELRRMTGSTYLLTGGALSLYLFEPNIAAISTGFIIVGDIFAAFVGKIYGRHVIYSHRNSDCTIRKKTWEGSSAFFVGALITGLCVPGISLLDTFLGAAVATLVELVSFFIDDNFSVPIAVGIFLQFIMHGHLSVFQPF